MPNTVTLGVKLTAIDELTAVIKKTTQHFKEFQRTVQGLDTKLAFNNLTGSLGKLQSSIGTTVSQFSGLGLAATGAFAAIIKPASSLEDLRFQMDNLLGSTQKGELAFKKVLRLAKETPYQLGTVVDFFNQVQAADPTNKGLTQNFSGLISVLARTQPNIVKAQSAMMGLTQAFTVGKLQTQDFKQIMNGLPQIKPIIESVTGFKGAGLYDAMSKGLIKEDSIVKIVQAMSKLKGVGNVSDLLSVKISNLGDVWSMTAYDIMNKPIGELPLIGSLKKDLDNLLGMLGSGLSDTQLKDIARTLDTVYKTGKMVVTDFLIPAGKFALNLIDIINSITGGPANSIKLLLVALAAPAVIATFGAIVSFATFLVGVPATIGGIVAGVGVFMATIAEVGLMITSLGGTFSIMGGVITTVLGTIFSPVNLLVAAILLLGYAAFKVVANWDKAKTPWQNILNGLTIAFNDLWNAIRPILQGIPLINKIPGIAKTASEIAAEKKAKPAGKPPGRASGGRVSAGVRYRVGERGEEDFIPSTNGFIIPNHQLGRANNHGALNWHVIVEDHRVSIIAPDNSRKVASLDMGHTRTRPA